jgi:hypothetical protein
MWPSSVCAAISARQLGQVMIDDDSTPTPMTVEALRG